MRERDWDEAEKDRIAEIVGVAAIKYSILRSSSGSDIVYSVEESISTEGDSGPYLQYAHARAHQLVEKAREHGVEAKVDACSEPNEVARLIVRFPDIVERSAKGLEPQLVANYLIGFASAFNRWYANEQILDGTRQAAHKVALVDAARVTLKNGLWLLGISAPERM